MKLNRVIIGLLLTVAVCRYHVSARRLAEDADLGTRTPRQSEPFESVVLKDQPISEDMLSSSVTSRSFEYKDLEEIDRLKLSINELICETMEEGCEEWDESSVDTKTTDHVNESFASVNPNDHVREY